MSTVDRLTAVLHTVLEPTPWRLEEVTISPAGRRSVVRVVVDRDLGDVEVVSEPSEPLSMDEVSEATRSVSAVLDESDLLGSSPYTLEVSSPGVSRPLTQLRHFQRNVGRLVRVVGAELDITGRLVEAGPGGIVLDVVGSKKVAGGRVRVPFADVTRADVQIEFNRPDAQTGDEHPDALDPEED